MNSSRVSGTIKTHVTRTRLKPNLRWRRPNNRYGYCSACDAAGLPDSPKAKKSTPTLKPLEPPPADHRIIGVQRELFTTSKYSPGSAIFLPNGTKIFNRLTNFLRSQYEHYGFQEVISPTIYKKSLWEKSGHWENYAEDMYSVSGHGAEGKKEDRQVGEDEEYGLKPMNCPGHCLIFASKKRSYRDLPIRYADFSPLHRNELTGALSGLTRGRRFHQDDGHIFCRPSQIRDEISKSLDFVRQAYGVLGLGSYRLALSTRPADHFIGTIAEWDNAEAALRESLNSTQLPWTLNEGDGAFYGPKIDIILKDSDGKEHQTATIQLDFQLPKRFELEYQAPAPELEQRGMTTNDSELLAVEGSVTPVMIHRAVLGSVERMMALMIERYDTSWPFWLNPNQVVIVTLNDTPELVEYALKVKKTIQSADNRTTAGFPYSNLPQVNGLSVAIDNNPEPLKKKIADAKSKKFGIIVVVGNKNIDQQNINVDFAGLSKSQYDVANHPILQTWLEGQSKPKSSGTAIKSAQVTHEPSTTEQILEVTKAKPESEILERTLESDGGKSVAENSKPPNPLTTKQLRNVDLSPANLRVILEDLRAAYV
ncbi:Class II aaRS and biotin synthetase [Glarea lozoyensis ATCC 20868]|uniref:threonine--tRNA ligase n=1 Tax=Glarea lozoyensis (strain ATCC 20868 / MF5171) TaxID=1116229 RepID=S3CWP4_GLAL2|nr:Class II aaRS and biotin synthetase [Glarea lozoyensis ATCC 20868]EPE29364.1 Class II aaRS and biotin synthetase [Glarea lozoyensis ATCC 20868]